MTSELDPRSELRARLGDWFVEEMSVVDPAVPVRVPSAGQMVDSAPNGVRGRRWLVGANVALLIGLVAGLVAVSLHDVDGTPPVAPVVSIPAEAGAGAAASMPSSIDVSALVTGLCTELDKAVEPLVLGATSAIVERIVEPIVAALEESDARLASLVDDEQIGEIRDMLTELGTRLEDLPVVAATATRDTFDQSVANVDLLLVAAGRRLEEAGGTGCTAISTLRDRS
jgi:hypothetical protein